jgi:hypothetical protein
MKASVGDLTDTSLAGSNDGILKKLLHDYSLPSLSISTIDLARTKWSDELNPRDGTRSIKLYN